MLGYISGVYDILRSKDLEKLDAAIQINREKGNKYFAIALYDDVLCQVLGIDTPLKTSEERTKIVEQLAGVDFSFVISSLDEKLIRKQAEEGLEKYCKDKEKLNKRKNVKKPYKIAYAPGTYDLFHLGHLENLLEAHNKSEKLVVGVKADELVREHKGRNPVISANERMDILRHFKFVDNVYQYFTRDPHIASTWIKSKYQQDIDAVFLGSDLKKDFEDIKDINIVFTDRDEQNMKNRSTSGYIKKLKLRTLDNKQTYTGNIHDLKTISIEPQTSIEL